MKKLVSTISFGVLSFLLGAFAGLIIWCVLKIMKLGMELLWESIPLALGIENMLIYNLVFCLTGGLIIGLMQKKYGLLPDTFPDVMRKIKIEKRYPYNNLHIVIISALLPLIFGGTIGPEAGLSGVVAGLSYFAGDRLKYKKEQISALMETGVAATLGAIFGTPLFGIVNNIEPDDNSEKYTKKFFGKKTRIYVYIMGVAGAMIVIKILKYAFGGGEGFPRFEKYYGFGMEEWMWIIPLIFIGIIFGIIYLIFHKISLSLSEILKNNRILSCMIAGAILAVAGYFFPMTMFSGEIDTWTLMEEWETMGVYSLLIIGIVKLFLVNFCINLGWRGGHIFPMIFSGVAVGYACELIFDMDGTYAVALVCGALYAYVARKPATVIAILLLCFPVTYIVPLIISILVASKVPQPKFLFH